MNKKSAAWIYVLIILGLLLAAGIFVFFVPVPYTATEVYIMQEPYLATETYTDTEPYMGVEEYQEQVPISEEECRTDISLNPLDYLNRGIDKIDSLLKGDVKTLLETCKDVIKYRTITKSKEVVKYRSVQKERQITKYRDVKKERQVTKKATLFQIWNGQIDYYYEV